jgi:hypothetical protein
MYWNITGKQMIEDVYFNINQYTTTSLMSDSFLISRLNQSIYQLLRFKKWYWNSETYEINQDSPKIFTLPQRPKRILDISTELKEKIERTTYRFNDGVLQYMRDDVTVTLNQDKDKIYVLVEKRFEQFTSQNIEDELPIPPEYNDALEMLMTSKITPVRLGEWAGSYMANFKSEAKEMLTSLAITDSYNNPTDFYKKKLQ